MSVLSGRSMMMPPDKSKPCLCSICICGKHPCPGKRVHDPACPMSTQYRDDYQAHHIDSCPRAATNNRVTHIQRPATAGKEHYVTTNRAVFASPFDGGAFRPTASCRPPQHKVAGAGAFQGRTTNQELFQCPIAAGNPVRMVKGRRRPQTAGSRDVPFDGTTTNNFFQASTLAEAARLPLRGRAKSRKPKIEAYSGGALDAHTSYQVNYPPKPAHYIPVKSGDKGLILKVPETRSFTTTNKEYHDGRQVANVTMRCPAEKVKKTQLQPSGHLMIVNGFNGATEKNVGGFCII